MSNVYVLKYFELDKILGKEYKKGYQQGREDAIDEQLQEFAQWLRDNHYLVDEAFSVKLVEQYKEQSKEFKCPMCPDCPHNCPLEDDQK